MRKIIVLITLLLTLGVQATLAQAANVVLGSSVTLNGSFFSGDSYWAPGVISPGARIVNGVFAPEGTIWNQDGVWWNGSLYPDNNIVIDLPGVFTIASFTVQADDNDSYRISYLDSGNNWQVAYDVPYIFTFGLVTRSPYVLPAPIETSSLKVEFVGGDGFYSVSQVVANGTRASSVPEPSTMVLLSAGIAGLIALRRRTR